MAPDGIVFEYVPSGHPKDVPMPRIERTSQSPEIRFMHMERQWLAQNRVSLTGLGMVSVGGTLLWRPALFAGRFSTHGVSSIDAFAAATHTVTISLALGLLWLGSMMLVARVLQRHIWDAGRWGPALLAVSAYSILSAMFLDWQVDDAAITYAYSENLVRGYGLRLHPALPPEEAYSNTLWMLMLAGLRALGSPIPLAAKLLGTLMGTACIVLVFRFVARLKGTALTGYEALLVSCLLCTAPFVIWSICGLEHALQALLFLGLVWAAFEARLGWTALFGACLVLVRPEAPLVLACVGLVYGAESYAAGGIRRVLRLWPIGVLPALVLAGLVGFRLWYFGDPLPTPFYAKASDATLLRLGNVVGEGWRYVWSWMHTGSIMVLLPILLLARWRPMPRPIGVALAIVGGQLAFVIYAGGDWMTKWRFLAALVPVLALLTGFALVRLGGSTRRHPLRRTTVVASVVIALASLQHLVEFRTEPTTPYRAVAEIGHEFVQLAERLGIEEPVLAHHDAGGISYGARLELVDLGFLGDRWLAKHRHDPQAVQDYLLEEKRPDFFFGTTAAPFAAGVTRFHESPRFRRDYVRLTFVGDERMRSGLCHVRRDRVEGIEVEGIQVVRVSGVIREVIVQERATSSAKGRVMDPRDELARAQGPWTKRRPEAPASAHASALARAWFRAYLLLPT